MTLGLFPRWQNIPQHTRIEAQRFAILRDRFRALALCFERSAQPFARIGMKWPITALRGAADVFGQQALGAGQVAPFKK